nr:MAG TPA: GIY-YIG nuclease superfamily protein [Caudoviricetes sp.]
MENCIYRFLDINKKLLYIGKAKHLEERLSNHNHYGKLYLQIFRY